MEVWRIALIVVLGWFLCGALSTIIPQCSSRLRAKLILASRQNIQRFTERYARSRAYSRLHIHHLIGVDRMSDDHHLVLSYAVLLISGLWSYAILWFVHRKQLPGRISSGKP